MIVIIIEEQGVRGWGLEVRIEVSGVGDFDFFEKAGPVG